jgi:hypothetical protein
MTEPPNGSHVTWRELDLVLKPLTSDVAEVKGDVKMLLAGQLTAAAIATNRAQRVSKWRAWGPPLVAALIAGIVSAGIAAIVYL